MELEPKIDKAPQHWTNRMFFLYLLNISNLKLLAEVSAEVDGGQLGLSVGLPGVKLQRSLFQLTFLEKKCVDQEFIFFIKKDTPPPTF